MERDPQKRSQGFRDWERTVAGCAVPCQTHSLQQSQRIRQKPVLEGELECFILIRIRIASTI